MPSVRDRMTPLFLGGSLTFPAFLPRPKRAGRFKADNHSGMRDIKEGGFAAFLARIDVTPPPSERVTNI